MKVRDENVIVIFTACNGTLPDITTSTTNCTRDASGAATMNYYCPVDQNFAGSNVSSFSIKCENVTVNGTVRIMLNATNNGTKLKTCQPLCPADPPQIGNATRDWNGVKTATTSVRYNCSEGFAFERNGKAFLRPGEIHYKENFFLFTSFLNKQKKYLSL